MPQTITTDENGLARGIGFDASSSSVWKGTTYLGTTYDTDDQTLTITLPTIAPDELGNAYPLAVDDDTDPAALCASIEIQIDHLVPDPGMSVFAAIGDDSWYNSPPREQTYFEPVAGNFENMTSWKGFWSNTT